jgi:CRP-like cAMP-binding protein
MPRCWDNNVGNRLLAALPYADYEALLPDLRPAPFCLREVIYEPGQPAKYVYFPTTCVVSLLYTTETGASADTGLVGNDGMLGIPLCLGGETMPSRAVVQIAGHALSMRASTFQDEFARRPGFRNILLRYVQALLTQVSQTAVCNRLHPMVKRLARRLLLCHDRVHCDELPMTQEFISQMLGGRRESVTVAAGYLQDAGLIRYSRGRIRIINRRGLEDNACECYQVVKHECDRLLGTLSPQPVTVQRQANGKSYATSA